MSRLRPLEVRLTVLSLFDGISCGLVALKKLGVEVARYYASEIDQHAIDISERNHPEIVRLGSIEDWRNWEIDWPKIDLILAGSPCQGFSSAGAQRGFDDPRSQLFFQFLKVLGNTQLQNPDVRYLLENVVMKKEWADIISDQLSEDPVKINSALVSAQNRNRLYWANWDFVEPEDRGVALADILEPGYWSTRNKSFCIDANYGRSTNFKRYFFRGSRQLVLEDGYDPRPGMTEENANEIMHRDGNRWRMLTPLECERLQCLPDGYTEGVKTTARYVAIGNAWTVDVIAHILGQGFRPSDEWSELI